MKRRNVLTSLFAAPAGLLLPAALKAKAVQDQKNVLLLESDVAGFQYYEGEKVKRRMNEGSVLRLVREPKNPYDYDAVQIFWGREKIGYIPRSDNSVIAQLMDRGVSLNARIKRLGGKENLGSQVGVAVEMVV